MTIKSELVRVFLRKLIAMRKWDASHTSEQKLLKIVKFLPPHEYKLAKAAYSDLVKQGIILVKPTHYGRQVSLSTKKKKIIEQLL